MPLPKCYFDIFYIHVKCNYYNSGISNDFKIVPSCELSDIFNRYSLSFIKMSNLYRLVCVKNDISSIKEDYKSIFKDVIMKFDIFVANKNIYNFCDLNVKETYLFKNEKKSCELKQSSIDLRANEVYEDKLFGKILINLSELTPDTVTEFFINIPVIKSFWVVNTGNTKYNINEYDFKINGKIVKFEQTGNANSYISKTPIELRESGFYTFNLIGKDKNTNNCIKIIPPLIYDNIIESKYVSNCAITD